MATGIVRTTIDRIIERESKMTKISDVLNEVMRTTRWEKKESDGSTEIRGWLNVEYPEGYKWYIRIASINLVTCNKNGEWHITVEGEQMIPVTIEQAAQIMSGMYQ